MKKIIFEITMTDKGMITLAMDKNNCDFNVAEVLGLLELAKRLVVEEGE